MDMDDVLVNSSLSGGGVVPLASELTLKLDSFFVSPDAVQTNGYPLSVVSVPPFAAHSTFMVEFAPGDSAYESINSS
jgi:hypothetical protein